MRFNRYLKEFGSATRTVLFMCMIGMASGSLVDDKVYYVVKRAVTSSSASATSTSKSASGTSSSKTSTTSKCTGSRQECAKPSNVDGLTVGLAIGIPVGVVILVCAITLYKVYRRNKKETQEDNDPDFDGDIEYLPSIMNGGYPLESVSNSSNSRSPVEFKENYDNYFPPFANNGGNRDSYRSARQRAVDPFFIPEVSDEHSLRDFTRQFHGEDYSPYRIASNTNSRSASHYSLPFEKNMVNVSQYNGSSLNTSSLTDAHNLRKHETRHSDLTTSSESQVYESPMKSTAGEAVPHYVEENSGCDVEHSRNDTTYDESFSHGISKPEPLMHKNEISRDTFNFEMLNSSGNDYESPFGDNAQILTPEIQELHDTDTNANLRKSDDPHEQNRILHLSAEEEENIKRMKSIYKVYLDRNGTVKQNPIYDEEENNAIVDTKPLTHANDSSQTKNPAEMQNVRILEEFRSEPQHDSVNQLGLPEDTNRVASSIYSMPVHQTHEDKIYNETPYAVGVPPGTDNQLDTTMPQYPPEQYSSQQYPMQQYNTQQNIPQQYFNHPYAMRYQNQQYMHPQTFEAIDELPTPTNLPYSSSSHSLTSFKPRAKQVQLTQLQAARINGTAVNPMDHPAMFYSQDDLNAYTSGDYNKAKAPYQLRQSVVMTNPSELTKPPRFKPAGSIRNLSAMSSRNNSLTTGASQQIFQQQMHDNRVSGLLNETDLAQPPGVSSVLPHSSSQDDLRKQIGSSHNYKIS